MFFAVTEFQGMAPRFADHLLRDSQASFASNLKPTSGELRGFQSLLPLDSLTPPGVYRRVERLYYEGSDNFVWFKSSDPEADVVLSPLVADAFQRVYFTEAGSPPQVTTLDALAADDPSTDLGVPVPTAAPGVNPTGGSGATDVRAYTYVYISTYGEVSSPAPPTVATGLIDSTWTITVPEVGTVGSGVVHIDIYRSSTGNATSGQYYKVGRISSGSSFVDSMAPDLVPLQLELDSFDYGPPPAELRGLVLHSSGALAGFAGRTVYFSQPYLPHAWPEAFRYNLDHEVVGLAAVSNVVVVMTRGQPVLLVGDDPSTITLIKLADYEPCLCKRSIVTVNNRAVYASSNGLISASINGTVNLTNDILTRQEWSGFSPDQIIAAPYGFYYVAFTAPSRGFVVTLPPYLFDGQNRISELVSIVNLDRYDKVTGIDIDARSGDVYVTQNDVVSEFDRVDDRRFATTFRTKEFITPKPVNMGALQILFPSEAENETLVALRVAAEAFNAARFAEGPLDGLDTYLIGGDIPSDVEPSAAALAPPPGNALGGSPLFDLSQFSTVPQIRATVIADGVIRYNRVITTEGVNKLPSGYKATRWYVELSGAARVQRIVLAETAKECRNA